MKEFIALKPKAYTYTTTKNNKASNNTLKGVPSHIRNGLNLDSYKERLYSNTRFSKDIFNLRFYNKHMSLTKKSKVILSSFVDKRCDVNNLESYGYGHPIIKMLISIATIIMEVNKLQQKREKKEKD